ncbi:THO complex subunit 4-B [Drosophila takahashii]|uniref:THO complex subunit 4-B n=1 Tax=Drosophila takahashii TaxID=29030 RepID=UPI003898DA08
MEIVMKKLEEILKLDVFRQKPKRSRRGKRRSGVTEMIRKPEQGKESGGVLKTRKGTGGVQKTTGPGPTLLLVCNLDYGVDDADIMELFNEDGLILKGTVHYDRHGKSLGTAELALRNHNDAMKVIEKFHGVRLDGRRLKIHLVKASPNVKRRAFKTLSKKRPLNRSVGRKELDSSPWESFVSKSL